MRPFFHSIPLILILLSFAYSSQTKSQISGSGSASIFVDPTDVAITFTIKTINSEASQALAENNKKMNAIIEALKKEQITEEELATSSFSIQTEYENIYVNDHYENIFKGYKASQSLIVTTKKFDLAGKLIDVVIESNDDTIVESVNFFVQNDVKNKIKNELIQKAVLNAKERVTLALKALDYEINGVENLSINDFNDGGWNQFRPLLKVESSNDKTALFAGSSEISLSVSAVFSIKKQKQ